ncbi:MAG: GNAT family N-acetyltransferase [Chloroflexi bacterium]|nr:GNAT family N-acetyltransferase [Chloroflexota bacterium]
MSDSRLLEHMWPWIEEQFGFALRDAATDTPIVAALPEDAQHPLIAVRAGGLVAVAAREEWVDGVRQIVEDLHADLLFSIVGAYELSRVTLPDDVAVWGPIPGYVADGTTWISADDDRPVRLTQEQVGEIDWSLFWHSGGPNSLAHFGIYQNGRLIALSSLSDQGHNIWEIGVDVAPDLKARGLGTAVVGAAGDFALTEGAVLYASAALWNVPSGRSLRRMGMRYTYSAMLGRPGPFLVPPQPIGEPLPGTPLYDYYPRWAMNKGIREQPSS